MVRNMVKKSFVICGEHLISHQTSVAIDTRYHHRGKIAAVKYTSLCNYIVLVPSFCSLGDFYFILFYFDDMFA